MAIFLKSFLFNLISPNHIKFTTNYFNTYCRKKQEETLKNAGNPVGFAAGFSMVGREGLPDGTRGACTSDCAEARGSSSAFRTYIRFAEAIFAAGKGRERSGIGSGGVRDECLR